jgi:hypothetical protein
VNNKQIVVTGLKDIVIPVEIFSTCITWMIIKNKGLTQISTLRIVRTIVELFKYILGQLERTKQYVKMTCVIAGKFAKHDITFNLSSFLHHNFGGSNK